MSRAIRGVHLGVVNFTSHFIVIQIFQILFLPPVSFYTHPNISDIFVGDKINLFNYTYSAMTTFWLHLTTFGLNSDYILTTF